MDNSMSRLVFVCLFVCVALLCSSCTRCDRRGLDRVWGISGSGGTSGQETVEQTIVWTLNDRFTCHHCAILMTLNVHRYIGGNLWCTGGMWEGLCCVIIWAMFRSGELFHNGQLTGNEQWVEGVSVNMLISTLNPNGVGFKFKFRGKSEWRSIFVCDKKLSKTKKVIMIV